MPPSPKSSTTFFPHASTLAPASAPHSSQRTAPDDTEEKATQRTM
jgi:hypothetical protein